MGRVGSYLLVAAISGALGAFLALHVVPSGGVAHERYGRPSADELKRALAGIESALGTISDHLARTAEAELGGARSRRVGAEGADRGADSEDAEGAHAAPDRQVAHPDRVAQLAHWDEQPGLRLKWMFAGEIEALSWFGTPDRVYTSESAVNEYWEYGRSADGEGRRTLVFSRGRLIDVR